MCKQVRGRVALFVSAVLSYEWRLMVIVYDDAENPGPLGEPETMETAKENSKALVGLCSSKGPTF